MHYVQSGRYVQDVDAPFAAQSSLRTLAAPEGQAEGSPFGVNVITMPATTGSASALAPVHRRTRPGSPIPTYSEQQHAATSGGAEVGLSGCPWGGRSSVRGPRTTMPTMRTKVTEAKPTVRAISTPVVARKSAYGRCGSRNCWRRASSRYHLGTNPAVGGSPARVISPTARPVGGAQLSQQASTGSLARRPFVPESPSSQSNRYWVRGQGRLAQRVVAQLHDVRLIAVLTAGRPPCLPLRSTAANPSRGDSRMFSRSLSAIAGKIRTAACRAR